MSAGTSSAGTVATINDALALGADTTVDVGLGTLTLGGVVSGPYAIDAVNGPTGTLAVGGNADNTYSGGTVLTSGTVAAVSAFPSNYAALGSGTITLDGGNLVESGAFQTLANPFVVNDPSSISGGSFFTLTGNGVLNANLTVGSLTFTGALSGSGGLIEDGGIGSTTLGGTAANTFTGGVTIYSGSVGLDKTAGVNALVSPVTIVGSSGNLTLGASDQLNGGVAVALGGGGTFNTNGFTDSVQSVTGTGNLDLGTTAGDGLTVIGGGAQLLTAVVNGSDFLTYSGSGSLTLGTASSSYTGTLTAAAGALIVDANFSGATAAVTGGTFGGTGVVKSVAATAGTLNPATAGTGGTFSTAASSSAVASSLSGATFQADLAPQGVSDELALGSDATLDLAGATLALNATGSTLASEYQIITSPTGGLSGTFTGLADNATLTLAGRTLQITYTAYAVTLTNVGATTTTLHWTGAASSNWSTAGNWEEDVAPASGDTLVFDTTTPGFAATTAAFAPTDDISGLTGLALVLNSASSAGNFVLGGAAFGLATSGVALAATMSAGTGTTINDALALGADTAVDVGLGTLTLGGVVSGPYALTAAGSPAGTLTLNVANTYTGGTVLTSGTVAVNTSTSLGTGTLTFAGGTLANATAFLTLTNPFVVNAPSTIGGGSFFGLSGNGTLNAGLSLTNSGFLTLSGALSGTGGLTENGFPGNTILGGTTANSFTGPTTIISGTLALDKTPGVDALVSGITLGGGAFPTLTWQASNQLNDGVSIYNRGTLSTSGFSDSVSGLNGDGGINTGSTATAGLTVTGAGANLITGAVSGSGLLTYNGTGSLTLAGASSSYTGKLTAAQGTLVVAADFSGSSAITSTGGTLGGTGLVGTLATGGTGTISPGGSGGAGILSTKGGSDTSALAGETLQVELSDLGPSGQLVVGNAATLNLTNATLSATLQHSTAGAVFTIVSSATGGLSGTFAGLPDGSTLVVGNRSFQIHYTANAVTLTDLQTIALSPATLPAGEAGQSYSQSITSTGGSGTVTLAVSGVTNTTGLTIAGTGTGTITLTGTPTSSGTVTFTVTPSDSHGPQAGQTYSIAVNPAVALTPSSLPPAEVGRSYNQSITATGGTGAVTLAVSGVTNTTGLTIAGTGTGTITLTGTPTSSGTVTFTVTPTDGIGTGTGTVYSVAVNPAVALTPSSLPPAEVGRSYNQSITATGGTGAVTLAVSGVTNTTGLTIAGTGTGTITLTGTPTSSGTVTFTVTPTDGIGTGTATVYSVAVAPAIVLTPSTPPPAEVGRSYNQSITATGGTGAVTLAVSGVTNTTGLTISGSGTGTITLTGTPTTSGTVTFTVTPTDGSGTGTGTVYAVAVNPAVALTPATLPVAEVGVTYHETITSTGGSPPVTLAVSGVTNTTGLTIAGTGTGTITLTGTPTATGTVTFTVTPTDGSGAGAATVYSLAVGPTIVLTPSLPAAEVGQSYDQSITSSGGSGPVTLAVSGVTNATGLTIAGTGTGTITLTGTPTTSGTVTFTVTPTDGIGPRVGTVYAVAVNPALALTPVTLPAAEAGRSYSQSITATGGTGAVTLAVSGVTNTTGLTISGIGTGTITLTGTPTNGGTVTFTVTPTDSSGTGAATVYSVVVADQPLVAFGSAGAGSGIVTAYDPQTGAMLAQFAPFGAYAGGVKVAVGDVTGGGYEDLIVMAGPGALNGLVEIYSGQDFALLSEYFAFPGYAGAFNLAAGDLTGNGIADVIFSTATGGDFVFAYAGDTNTFIVSPFSAFGGFTGGVTVAAGDVRGNGVDQIIVGTASQVGAAGVFNQFGQLLQPYYFAPVPMNGVNVAAGDLNDTGHDDVILGAMNSTLVLEYDGASQALMGYFFALPGQPFGVTVATVDPTGSGYADLVVGFTGDVSAVGLFGGLSFQLVDVYGQPSGAAGVNVAGSA